MDFKKVTLMTISHIAKTSSLYLGIITTGIGLCFLLLVALYPLGLYSPYPLPPQKFVDGKWGGKEIKTTAAELHKRADEVDEVYFLRLTKQVSNRMIHYWPEGDLRYTRVSIFDNYLIWYQSFNPKYRHFQNYEFVSPQKAIDRGYGFCSQVSRIVYSILREQGYPAEILNNANHVVVEVNKHIIDADYGVMLPHSWTNMQSRPDLVETYYKDFPGMQKLLKKVYAEGWIPLNSDKLMDYMRKFEQQRDLWKWYPPIALIVAGFIFMLISLLLPPSFSLSFRFKKPENRVRLFSRHA